MMKLIAVILSGLLAMVSNEALAKTPIWLEIHFEDLPGYPKNGTGESILQPKLAAHFNEIFPVYEWQPRSRDGAEILMLNFLTNAETNKVLCKFSLKRTPILHLPGETGPWIKLGEWNKLKPKVTDPRELAEHILHALQEPLATLEEEKWKERFCMDVPVVRLEGKLVHSPPPPLQVQFPFNHPSYVQNMFEIKGIQNNQGVVSLEVEGLQIDADHLNARIQKWTQGGGVIVLDPPPANIGAKLTELEQVRIHLQSMKPRMDPNFN